MKLFLKKVLFSSLSLLLVFASLAGCSGANKDSPSSAGTSSQNGQTVSSGVSSADSAVSAAPSSEAPSSQQDDPQKTFLLNLQKEAQEGKVIRCEFPVETKTIEDVQEKWGKEDKSEYIASAKGIYNTYSKHNIVFGFNKGSQLFEVRSFDSQLKEFSLSKVEEVFGKPDYNVKSGNENIIGYVVSKEFKILLVFPNPKTSGDDPKLDHYSVFYPQGTVNLMADDPGRQW